MSKRLLNSIQFDALAELLPKAKSGEGAAREAARLVLVDGMTGVGAAQLVGTSPANVSNAVVRFRRVLELARVAVGSNRE